MIPQHPECPLREPEVKVEPDPGVFECSARVERSFALHSSEARPWILRHFYDLLV